VGLTRAEGGEQGEPGKYYPTGRRTYGRVVPADHVQAAAVVFYMKDQGCTNAYILNNKELYGRGIANQVERVGNALGVRILGNDGIDAKPADVRAAAARIKAAAADCFFFGGFTFPNGPEVFKAVAAASPNIKLFGPDAVAELAFTSELGTALQKRVFITNPTLDIKSYPPRGQRFFKDFKARYGRYPEPYAIYGYEAMSVVLSSIRHADRASTSARGRRAVVDAFFAQRGRRSVLGTYDIDDHGDTTLPYYGGYRPRGGRLFFDKVITITP
jgi:branched-chain amino acid transport system substrate-binding protein